jgi:hypothetical protein
MKKIFDKLGYVFLIGILIWLYINYLYFIPQIVDYRLFGYTVEATVLSEYTVSEGYRYDFVFERNGKLRNIKSEVNVAELKIGDKEELYISPILNKASMANLDNIPIVFFIFYCLCFIFLLFVFIVAVKRLIWG